VSLTGADSAILLKNAKSMNGLKSIDQSASNNSKNSHPLWKIPLHIEYGAGIRP
jgi:hypothetical protein